MSIDDQMQSMQKSINKIAESVVYNNEMLKHKNVIIQEVKNISVVDNNDYKEVFSALLHDKDKEKYKDLIRFAFMLEKKDYVKFADPAKLQTITDEELKNNYYIETSAFFCNTNSFQMFSNSKGSAVLEQCYTKELFSNSTTSFLSIPSNDIYKSVKDGCANCLGCDEAFALCPYKLCALIKLISKNWNKDPMGFYKRFLENEVNVLFPESKPIRFSKDAQILQEIEGIDSKSALSAYILCQLGLFNSEEITENKATFTFLKLCQGHQPKQKLGEVLNFWKTKQGYYGSIIPSQKETVTKTKDNCRSCSYLQCPHRVAAYASYLGKKYNVDVLDLLKFIAENNTAGNLDGRENFQYDKYISNINSLPITTESKKEYIEIIKYILNSRSNIKIP
ncbi:MAG: hypothetical protein IKC01_01860, partial [Clostridia bacterium]|nr:hypothetical protein [Clostridia bacterium]